MRKFLQISLDGDVVCVFVYDNHILIEQKKTKIDIDMIGLAAELKCCSVMEQKIAFLCFVFFCVSSPLFSASFVLFCDY